eukprot:TRINITY_DN47470_c0_g1_i1.p1 TRINITY_DN47470_c0_g1~~TRINITY_DN47470_c0_g1_i1.p1  ORF type:complete len:372 (+),score=70.73 TRINITY_DN47470_c0_g1_i1:179-1294(+)
MASRFSASPRRDPRGMRGDALALFEPTSSPYTFFYPQGAEHLVMAPPKLVDASKTLLEQTSADRAQRQEYIRSVEHLIAGDVALSIVHRAFALVLVDGHISRTDFVNTLLLLSPVPSGTDPAPLYNAVFQLIASSTAGGSGVSGNNGSAPVGDGPASTIEYAAFLQALSSAIRGSRGEETAKRCFALFDSTGCGRILRRDLQGVRSHRQELASITHAMIRHLLVIIDAARDDAVDAFVKTGPRTRKAYASGAARQALQTVAIHPTIDDRRRGIGAPSDAVGADATGEKMAVSEKMLRDRTKLEPLRPATEPFGRKESLGFAEFRFLLQVDPVLVQAFLPAILACVAEYSRQPSASIGGGAATGSGGQGVAS